MSIPRGEEGQLYNGRLEKRSTCMKEMLIEEGLNKQGWTVWIGRVGGSSALVIHLRNVPKRNEASDTIDRID